VLTSKIKLIVIAKDGVYTETKTPMLKLNNTKHKYPNAIVFFVGRQFAVKKNPEKTNSRPEKTVRIVKIINIYSLIFTSNLLSTSW
jgi:hypothetical protein